MPSCSILFQESSPPLTTLAFVTPSGPAIGRFVLPEALSKIILARHSGMKLMQEYALEPVRKGLTTPHEILRVVPLEQIPTTRYLACGHELPPTFAFCPYCGETKIDQGLPVKHRHSLVEHGATGE
jgi:hypothetical protein